MDINNPKHMLNPKNPNYEKNRKLMEDFLKSLEDLRQKQNKKISQ